MGGCHRYPPLFAFCPHLLTACFAVNWHLPSILNIAYRQVNISYNLKVVIFNTKPLYVEHKLCSVWVAL